jgi:hypothetical protein
MEGLLTMAKEHLLTDKVERQDACGKYQIPDYGPFAEMPTARPDVTAEAGTIVTENDGYIFSPLWSPDEREDAEESGEPFVVLGIPAEVPRVQGLVQFAWKGGDPGVDLPLVTLQVKGQDGTFADVLTSSGRPVTSGPDILLTTTPDPLYPADAPQSWTWYAAWQAVGHNAPRTGLPEGVYRLHVEGHSFEDDGATTWPWASTPYTLDSDEFTVVPGVLSVAASGTDLQVWLQAPERGYRLIGLGGSVRGANPVEDSALTVTLVYTDGSEDSTAYTGAAGGGITTVSGALPADLTGIVEVIVTDAHGNEGRLSLAAE